MRITQEVGLRGSARVETIARAIYAYNQFPGRKADEVPWPPERKQTLIRAWNMATVIDKALTCSETAGSELDEHMSKQADAALNRMSKKFGLPPVGPDLDDETIASLQERAMAPQSKGGL